MFPKTGPYSAYPYSGGAAYSTFNKRSPYGKCSSRPPVYTIIYYNQNSINQKSGFIKMFGQNNLDS